MKAPRRSFLVERARFTDKTRVHSIEVSRANVLQVHIDELRQHFEDPPRSSTVSELELEIEVAVDTRFP